MIEYAASDGGEALSGQVQLRGQTSPNMTSSINHGNFDLIEPTPPNSLADSNPQAILQLPISRIKGSKISPRISDNIPL